MPQTINFTVNDETKIHCVGCEQRIGNALHRLPGILDVQASAETQRVVATIDSARIGPEQVQEKLERLGYKVAA